MNPYNESKIYIIKSNKTDMVYIGSTTRTLEERFKVHKTKPLKCCKELMKYDDIFIELLENYSCNGVKELEKKEYEYINKYKNSVNIVRRHHNNAIESAKLWNKENKERRHEIMKKSYLKKNNLDEYNKIYNKEINNQTTLSYEDINKKIEELEKLKKIHELNSQIEKLKKDLDLLK